MEVNDSFPGPVVPGRCGGVTVVMNCLHSPVCHVLQRRGDRPGRRERGGGTATGSTISSGACMNNCGKRVKHGCSHTNTRRCGDFQCGQVFCRVLYMCLVCVCCLSVSLVGTEWLASYSVIKFFCDDGSVFGNGMILHNFSYSCWEN